MVKNLKKSFHKLIGRKSENNSIPKSPVIQINSEPLNENIFQSEEQIYTKVEDFLYENNSFESDLRNSDTISSTSSLNIEYDFKNLRKEKKIKKRLSEVGNKAIAELIAYLHSDKQLVKSKFDIDCEEIQLLQTLDSAVDLDKYFKEKKSKIKDKLWKTPIVFSKRDTKNITDSSLNGLHSVNRFGEGVADGCTNPLSLASKGRTFGDVFHKPLEWNDIIEEADQVLSQYENLNKKNPRMARRGSLLQPRYIFLSPHPEVMYERVLQSANCLPLRAWTSELFLDSKESSQIMDSETKRNLKWNASVDDFRHLLSPELSHFGNDVYSMLVQARRRMSLCPPQTDSQPIPFRRKSYNNGEVWTAIDPNKHKKKDYDQKLEVIRQNTPNSVEMTANPKKSQITNSLLILPNQTIPWNKKKTVNLNDGQCMSSSEESIELISIETIDPKVMANELTLIAKQLFLSIQSTEMITLLIRPHSISPSTCSDITALLGFQKRIIQLITSYILDEIDVQISAQRMAYFIEVAKELKSLRNWHSVYSLVLSLQSPPIARLRQSWQYLSNHFSDIYCEFIELSEQLKKDVGPLDYTSPSIPLFEDLLDDLKERCGSKFFEIKKHRFHNNWSKRETIAVWVDQQVIDLINVAKDKKKIQKRVEKIRKNSNEFQTKGILKRFLSRSNSKESKESDSGSHSTGSDERTDSITSLSSDFRFRSKLTAGNSPVPSCKNIWSVADIHKLRDIDEKEVLQEIARGMVCYQRNAVLYYLDESNEIVRNFLLLQSYDELDVCMKKSYQLESSKSSVKTSLNI